MSSVYEKLISRITDNYNRSEDSDIAKMMKLAAKHIQENEDTLQRVHDWRDIDQAQGVSLDYIGRSNGRDRDGFDDDLYRVLIKAQIIKNHSDGSIPTVIRYIAFLLGIEKEYIKIQEKWITGSPVGLYIELDMEFVEALGLELLHFCEIVNDLLVPGVHADIHLRGSFMFSDFDNQVQEDDEQGFGEVVTDTLYYTGKFAMGDINEKSESERMLVDEMDYFKGDYYMGSALEPTTQTTGLAESAMVTDVEGYADDELPIGGKFGAYYKISGFKEGTNKIIRAW